LGKEWCCGCQRQRESDDGNGREAGILYKLANCKDEIVHSIFDLGFGIYDLRASDDSEAVNTDLLNLMR